MTLESYRRPRMVIRTPDTPVREAARAMDSNHIGCVVVQERGKIVGMVTDRDIALRVIGRGLDSASVGLRDVMTPHPVVLPISADESNAVDLMRRWHVRRIPLVDAGRVVGIITLDDLVLSEDVASDAVADVVRAQLTEPARHKPAGAIHPEKTVRSRSSLRSAGAVRHRARVIQTFHRAARLVKEATGLDDLESAMAALEIVAGGIVRRLTPTEASHLLSQLPVELQEKLQGLPGGPDRSLTRETIEAELMRKLDVEPERASELAAEVGRAFERLVSPGEIADVRAQLPADLRAILTGEVVHLTP